MVLISTLSNQLQKIYNRIKKISLKGPQTPQTSSSLPFAEKRPDPLAMARSCLAALWCRSILLSNPMWDRTSVNGLPMFPSGMETPVRRASVGTRSTCFTSRVLPGLEDWSLYYKQKSNKVSIWQKKSLLALITFFIIELKHARKKIHNCVPKSLPSNPLWNQNYKKYISDNDIIIKVSLSATLYTVCFPPKAVIVAQFLTFHLPKFWSLLLQELNLYTSNHKLYFSCITSNPRN